MGLYQPDTIATYEHRGRVYLVMVNEGDARDNGSGDSEDDRRGSAGSAAVKYVPDGMVFDSGSRLDRAAIRLGIYDDGRSDNKGVEPEGPGAAAHQGPHARLHWPGAHARVGHRGVRHHRSAYST